MDKFSWKTIDDTKVLKELDLSSFSYKVSVIPQDYYSFFNINKKNLDITLQINKKKYPASIKWAREESPVARLWWQEDFAEEMKKKFPKWINRKKGDKFSNMKLIFEKTDDIKNFMVSFKDDSEGLIFGHINGISIGDIFESRKELSESRLHAPPMGGIWGRGNEGSCSIVLSGGYEDDIDNLDYILYTGQGGQDSPGGKQVSDQEFSRGNRGLQLSCEYKLPVRVIRGHQVYNGPEKGYRYDGIYYVTSYERVKGKSGYYICRFHLESELYISDLEKKLDENLPENYQASERIETTINRINRNIKLREKIKEIYQYRCQICNVYLKKPHGAIAIGAHIKGLGQPHNGPDVLSNMLCLCPNHHDQFDALSFYINPDDFMIMGLEDFEGEKITINNKHEIKSEYLKYHMNQFIKKNN
jgi:putative restriction endonuclease|tara:strand:- start:26 stop:1273 length:1248 start_codon:yes stop_codon:yes gene_type:complete